MVAVTVTIAKRCGNFFAVTPGEMRTSVTPTLTRAGRNKHASKLSSAVTGGRMAFAFWFDPTAINGNYAEWVASEVRIAIRRQKVCLFEVELSVLREQT